LQESIDRIYTVIKREVLSYFTSPLAYIFIIIFLLLSGFFTFSAPPFGNFLNSNQASLAFSFFPYHSWLYLVLVPPISMRLWSEEQKNGTIEILFTTQISILEAVIGKFISAWIIILISLFLTFPIIITVNWLGTPDNNIIISGYLGSALLGAGFLSIGCMTSAMSKNQIISYIYSMILCLLLILFGHQSVTNYFTSWAPVWFTTTLGQLSIFPHYKFIINGIIDVGDIIYFISIIIFGLFATVVILNTKRNS